MAKQAAAGPQLATYVHVADSKSVVHVFGPGDDVPTWAQRAITNPKAWVGGELPKVRAASKPATTEAPTEDAPEETAPEDGAEGEQPEVEAEVEPDAEAAVEEEPETPEGETPAEATDLEAPPRQGPGSGKAAWHTYAKARGLDVSDETTRDEVIELLEDAGLLEDEQPA